MTNESYWWHPFNKLCVIIFLENANIKQNPLMNFVSMLKSFTRIHSQSHSHSHSNSNEWLFVVIALYGYHFVTPFKGIKRPVVPAAKTINALSNHIMEFSYATLEFTPTRFESNESFLSVYGMDRSWNSHE